MKNLTKIGVVSGAFAPTRSARFALLVATFLEASAFGAVVLTILSKPIP